MDESARLEIITMITVISREAQNRIVAESNRP
jgi:hypothetical protein